MSPFEAGFKHGFRQTKRKGIAHVMDENKAFVQVRERMGQDEKDWLDGFHGGIVNYTMSQFPVSMP